MSEIKEFIAFMALGMLFTAVLIAALTALAHPLAVRECRAKTDAIGFASDYSFFGGCRIRLPDGRWIPLESYRVTQPTE